MAKKKGPSTHPSEHAPGPGSTIGDRIKYAIGDIDRVELLRRIHKKSQSTLSHWTSNRHTPSDGDLILLAKATGYRFEWLRDGDGAPLVLDFGNDGSVGQSPHIGMGQRSFDNVSEGSLDTSPAHQGLPNAHGGPPTHGESTMCEVPGENRGREVANDAIVQHVRMITHECRDDHGRLIYRLGMFVEGPRPAQMRHTVSSENESLGRP